MLQDRANMLHSLSFYSDQMDRRLCDRFLVGILSCSMARVGFTLLRSLRNAINPSLFKPQTFRPYTSNANASRYVDRNHVRLPFSYSFLRAKELSTFRIGSNASYRTLVSGHVLDGGSHKVKRAALVSASFKRLHVRGAFPSALAVPLFGLSSRPSLFSTKADKPGNTEAPGATGETNVISSDGLASDWVDKVKHAWQSTLDTVTNAGHKAKEASDELTPHVQQLLDTYPYLNDVVVPVSLTLTGTVLAWVVMPRILRKFHKYATQGTVTLLPGSLSVDQFPYERSFWGALEDPVRYLITFMAFSQIGMLVAPTTIASQYISPAWRGAVILSFVWFLQRMKTNLLARALAAQSLAGLDREKLLTLDKVSSVGLFVIGLMAMSEACGVAVQSILTVGGIGGVATAFAARDVLGNVLSGLSMQFSKPFSLGDTIKAGSIEGQVVEMGLTTTSLLNAEKFPVLVPNSMFSSQVIVNKSRAEFRAIVSKIPLQTDDLDKVPQISDEIKEMLRSNAKVFLGKESPYCYLSQVEKSFAELTLGCNLKHMKKDEMYSTQQEILLRSVEIIKKHGASLGDTWDKGSV